MTLKTGQADSTVTMMSGALLLIHSPRPSIVCEQEVRRGPQLAKEAFTRITLDLSFPLDVVYHFCPPRPRTALAFYAQIRCAAAQLSPLLIYFYSIPRHPYFYMSMVLRLTSCHSR